MVRPAVLDATWEGLSVEPKSSILITSICRRVSHISSDISEPTDLVKRISNRSRTQRLALSNPKVLRRLGAVHNHDGHIPHLHLVHIAIPLRPLAVLRRSIRPYGPQVADEREPRRAGHAGDAGLVADDLVDDDI